MPLFGVIRWRLTFWYVTVLALILLVLGTLVYVAVQRTLLAEHDHELELSARHVARSYLTLLDRGGRRLGEDIDERPAEGEPLVVTMAWTYIVSDDGWEWRSPNARLDFFPHRSALARVARSGTAEFTTLTTSGGETVRLYTLPVTRNGHLEAVIQAGKPITPVHRTLDNLVLAFLLTGAAGIILAGLGGVFLANRALVPIRLAFRRQREFVADASHELRTPLAILRASAEMLRKELEGKAATAGTAEAEELLGNILSETDRMGRLVGDLLTLARADSGELDVEIQPTDLARIARDAAGKAEILAREKGVALEARIPETLPVEGDAARLEQLLLILLDNAIKYTEPGGLVTLRLENQGHRPAIVVADTGIGIPAGDIPRIFDRFYRVDKARSRQQGGTGLGLAIAKWIIEAHNGQVHVESTPGKGTTFTITLPAPGRKAKHFKTAKAAAEV